MTKNRRMGRPPEGPAGAKVEDLPRVTIRLEPELKAALFAAAEREGRPAWRIVREALAVYLGMELEG